MAKRREIGVGRRMRNGEIRNSKLFSFARPFFVSSPKLNNKLARFELDDAVLTIIRPHSVQPPTDVNAVN